MNFGMIQKLVLSLVWKQAQKDLDALPVVPTNNARALADALDSRTVTGAAWTIVIDVVAVIWRVCTGEITLDEALMHGAVLLVAVLFCYCRHAVARHKVDLEDLKSSLKSAGIEIPDRSQK